jgi:hypothetical protein
VTGRLGSSLRLDSVKRSIRAQLAAHLRVNEARRVVWRGDEGGVFQVSIGVVTRHGSSPSSVCSRGGRSTPLTVDFGERSLHEDHGGRPSRSHLILSSRQGSVTCDDSIPAFPMGVLDDKTILESRPDAARAWSSFRVHEL